MNTILARLAILAGTLLLTACAASDLPGYRNAYHGYDVPQPLVEQIKTKFRQHGLDGASVARDSTGRIELTGTYHNEDEVDDAFTIVQSIVGIKSTSPFYPEHILQKRWEAAAGKALASYAHEQGKTASTPVKRALVIGINHFVDHVHTPDIQGADDAVVVQNYLQRAGYRVTALLDERATQAAVKAAIARLDSEIGPNDDVFLYVSSHGNLPVPTPGGQDQRRMSILVYDSGSPETMRSHDRADVMLYYQRHSVPDTLVQNLAKKPSHTTRVVIDTCYSGDMLDDIHDESSTYIRAANGGRREEQGISLASWTGPAYTTKGIRFSADDADAPTGAKGVRTAIDRSRSGYMLITATSPDEESLAPTSGTFRSPVSADRVLKGSYFTQSLFDYLGHYNGQLDPAFNDARSFTSRIAIQVSDGQAHQIPRQYSTIPSQQNDLLR
ncbi:caspase family protein [Burkholderia plantarii]|uniref:caspase family protein n=1 Tax=Burkholderia plantarii TaxID=41899 RepID=UPI00272AB7ED|nr:caspase family protein [Burkholderia plantarii]WLE62627.1 caspase family protein [Burkholderia plantarii]